MLGTGANSPSKKHLLNEFPWSNTLFSYKFVTDRVHTFIGPYFGIFVKIQASPVTVLMFTTLNHGPGGHVLHQPPNLFVTSQMQQRNRSCKIILIPSDERYNAQRPDCDVCSLFTAVLVCSLFTYNRNMILSLLH